MSTSSASIQGFGADDRSRSSVLWLGGPPPRKLQGECLRRGMELVPVSAMEISQAAPWARVFLLQVPSADPTFEEWGARVAAEALTHGLRVLLVADWAETDEPTAHDLEVVSPYFEAAKRFKALEGFSDPRRVEAMYQSWGEIAEVIARYDPGPSANSDLRIHGAGFDESDESLVLLRRACHDLSGIAVGPLAGGRSGASVWLVAPGRDDLLRRALPFVVKVQPREKMVLEQSNYMIVSNAIAPRLHAPLCEERCVEGYRLGLIVYDLVDRANALIDELPHRPGQLIASLFEHTLEGFLCAARPTHGLLAAVFDEGRLGVLRWSGALQEAAAVARTGCPTVLSVEETRARLLTLPAMEFMIATIHGDLHPGNLFVPAGSSEVLLIDYGSVRTGAPLVSDPACLEVGLSFPSRRSSAEARSVEVDPDWLRQAYQYPLSPPGRPMGSPAWIGTALSAVRDQVRRLEPNPLAYATAVLCRLLRFASYDDHAPLGERALAYELASGLLIDIENHAGYTLDRLA